MEAAVSQKGRKRRIRKGRRELLRRVVHQEEKRRSTGCERNDSGATARRRACHNEQHSHRFGDQQKTVVLPTSLVWVATAASADVIAENRVFDREGSSQLASSKPLRVLFPVDKVKKKQRHRDTDNNTPARKPAHACPARYFAIPRSLRAMAPITLRFASYFFCRSACHLRRRIDVIAGE